MGRMVAPLSTLKVKNAKPKEKLYRLSDGNGLVLEVKPNGKKVWRVRYTFAKKAKTYTIGEYPIVSLAEARDIAKEVKGLVLRGIDPVEHRRRQEREIILEERKRFGSIVQEFFEMKAQELSPKYLEKVRRRAEIYILPHLKDRNIDEITKRDIVELIKSVPKTKTPSTKTTDKGETAKRVFMLIKQIWRYAIHNDYTEDDVPSRIDFSQIMPKYSAGRMKAAIDERRIREIYKTIVEDFKGYEIVKLALRFLALTALRPGNVRNLRWEWVDLERKVVFYPAEAMKMDREFRLPLTDTLVGILKEAQGWMYRSEYVFCSPFDTSKMMSDNTLNSAQKRLGIYDHNAHGWRSSFSTICYEHQKDHGFSSEVIEAQLHHQIGNKVVRAYMRGDFFEERRRLLEWWEEFLGGSRV